MYKKASQIYTLGNQSSSSSSSFGSVYSRITYEDRVNTFHSSIAAKLQKIPYTNSCTCTDIAAKRLQDDNGKYRLLPNLVP